MHLVCCLAAVCFVAYPLAARGAGPESRAIDEAVARVGDRVVSLTPGRGVWSVICESKMVDLRARVPATDPLFRRAVRCVERGSALYSDGMPLLRRCMELSTFLLTNENATPGSGAASEYKRASSDGADCVRALISLNDQLTAHAALVEDVQYECAPPSRCSSDAPGKATSRELRPGSTGCRRDGECPRGQVCLWESAAATRGRCAK